MIILRSDGVTVDVPQPTQQQIQQSYLVEIIGVDGRVWDLNNGPAYLTSGVKLFGTPQVTKYRKKSPFIDGSRLAGQTTEARTLSLPIDIRGDDWASWRDNDSEFFASAAPHEGQVTIRVTSPDAVWKALDVTFEDDGDVEDDFDPLLMSRKLYALEYAADQPWWYGETVTTTVEVADPVPWLNPPGPPLLFSPPTISDSATITNPGDLPAWWTIQITAPTATFAVGVGDSLVSSTVPFAAGRTITVDSSPRKRLISDENGGRINDLMDTVAFAPIPPGVDVPLNLNVTGYGADTRLDTTLVPLYRRPL